MPGTNNENTNASPREGGFAPASTFASAPTRFDCAIATAAYSKLAREGIGDPSEDIAIVVSSTGNGGVSDSR